LVCWQLVLVGCATGFLTELVKRVLDVTITKERRKGMLWLGVALWVMPVVIAVLLATFVPLRPEPLLKYVAEYASGGWFEEHSIYALWGVPAGIGESFIYMGVRKLYKDRKGLA